MTTKVVAASAIAPSASSQPAPAATSNHQPQQAPTPAVKPVAPTETRQSQAWSEVPRTQLSKPKDDDASSTSSAGERAAPPPVRQPSVKGRPGQLPPITRPSKPVAPRVNFAEGDL